MMGFDLSGLKPKSEKGKYFGANVWTWHPIAEYVLTRCADIIPEGEDRFWQSNDHQKVSAEMAVKIAERLDELIASGDAWKFSRAYKKRGAEAKDYPFDIQVLKEFAEFCRDSGGFQID